ncbi:MAG: Fic family protein [Gemmatimonadetes bacterium]|nr:Fic family protein [Gemmatimonadota bacterium]MYE70030.1 Fic family protein [Gemmatimonadota bacterium]MYJ68950.1 Fic family protein [Gemmatimonadota bacterium]
MSGSRRNGVDMPQDSRKVPVGHAWRPIEDLPDDWQRLADSDLHRLADRWRKSRRWIEHREDLRPQGAIADFTERLKREWAIETGLIERVYTLTRGITELLIERGLREELIPSSATDRDPALVFDMIQDHAAAVDGLFDFVKQERQLSTSYIKELHSVLLAHQHTASARDIFGRRVEMALTRGEYKKRPSNPVRPDGLVHEYCPPEQVASEMDSLLAMHLEHGEGGVAPEVEAAWLHHRFTQIHPFQDGNGRVARALATLVMIRAGWLPLVVTDEGRADYIDALEAADEGDLAPLVQLFAEIQRRAFEGAIDAAGRAVATRG